MKAGLRQHQSKCSPDPAPKIFPECPSSRDPRPARSRNPPQPERKDRISRFFKRVRGRTRDAMTQIESVLTCPRWGHHSAERMPADACLILYECKGCGATLKPRPGDFACSARTAPCPAPRSKRTGDAIERHVP